ncbi:MAG: adenylate kinase [Bacteroidales bacterium]|nr:adenylate kinase [Bacteroidales bacterium]MDD4656696.1 adenylate kinase [Bacteroidales bacterium]
MKYLIIFGPPGAGKGTQSLLLTKKFNLKHISTGELLRKEIVKGTDIGIMAKALIDRGNFVDDSVVIEMISREISRVGPEVKGFIFDGFPRTISQAEAFDSLLEEHNKAEVTLVLSLEVSDTDLVERIRKRARVEGRKDDSSIETITKRIKTYHNKTEPLIAYYKRKGKYIPVKGELSVEEIFANICNIVEEIKDEQ